MATGLVQWIIMIIIMIIIMMVMVVIYEIDGFACLAGLLHIV